MSEVKRTFMQELNLWSEANVVGPLGAAASAFEGEDQDWEPTVEQVKKAIREKVLESYRNGLKAPRRPTAPALATVRR